MATYAPDSAGLDVANWSNNEDRCVVYPSDAAPRIVDSIEVYVAAGATVRACVAECVDPDDTSAAPLLHDFGMIENETEVDAFFLVDAPDGIVITADAFPIICERQNTVMALVGGDDYPHGDAISSSANYNADATISDPFPANLFDSELVGDYSYRIPYAKLNYSAASPPVARINLPIKDRVGADIANMTGVTVSVREASNDEETLAKTTSAVITSGKLIFQNALIGDFDDIVHVTFEKVDATDPTNYLKTLTGSAYAKVVSSATSDLS